MLALFLMLPRTQVIQAYVYHMYRRVINLGIICLTCHLFLPQCFYKFFPNIRMLSNTYFIIVRTYFICRLRQVGNGTTIEKQYGQN